MLSYEGYGKSAGGANISQDGSNESQIRHKPSLLSKSWHSRTASKTSSTKSDKKRRQTSNGHSERQSNVSETNSNISTAPSDSFRLKNCAPGPKHSKDTRPKNIGQKKAGKTGQIAEKQSARFAPSTSAKRGVNNIVKVTKQSKISARKNKLVECIDTQVTTSSQQQVDEDGENLSSLVPTLNKLQTPVKQASSDMTLICSENSNKIGSSVANGKVKERLSPSSVCCSRSIVNNSSKKGRAANFIAIIAH